METMEPDLDAISLQSELLLWGSCWAGCDQCFNEKLSPLNGLISIPAVTLVVLTSSVSETSGWLVAKGTGTRTVWTPFLGKLPFWSCLWLVLQLATVDGTVRRPREGTGSSEHIKIIILLVCCSLSAHALPSCICHVISLCIFGTDLDARHLFSLWYMKHGWVAFAKLELGLNIWSHPYTHNVPSFPGVSVTLSSWCWGDLCTMAVPSSLSGGWSNLSEVF